MRGRWDTYYNSPPRRAVEGGVVVPKPGKVTDPLAVALVAAAEMESDPKILGRGRTYARAGQVVAVQVAEQGFSAKIQGTRARPYEVQLRRTQISGADRVAATCSCPYGCDDGWCKHAAALAYVGAFLLERDGTARAAWLGKSRGEGDGAAADATGTAGSGAAATGAAVGAEGRAAGGAAGDAAGRAGRIPSTGAVPASALLLTAEDLAWLRSPLSEVDVDAMLAAAEAVVPHPAGAVIDAAPE